MAGRRVLSGRSLQILHADDYPPYWEDVGSLSLQERSGGQRRYNLDALRRVMFIRMARQSRLSQYDSCALGQERSKRPYL
jgi:hypothetical protein